MSCDTLWNWTVFSHLHLEEHNPAPESNKWQIKLCLPVRFWITRRKSPSYPQIALLLYDGNGNGACRQVNVSVVTHLSTLSRSSYSPADGLVCGTETGAARIPQTRGSWCWRPDAVSESTRQRSWPGPIAASWWFLPLLPAHNPPQLRNGLPIHHWGRVVGERIELLEWNYVIVLIEMPWWCTVILYDISLGCPLFQIDVGTKLHSIGVINIHSSIHPYIFYLYLVHQEETHADVEKTDKKVKNNNNTWVTCNSSNTK